jgi:ribonuclease HI
MNRNERCKQDFAELAPLLRRIQVKLKKVPAHKGIRGNEYADQLAKEVTRQKIQELVSSKRRRYRY